MSKKPASKDWHRADIIAAVRKAGSKVRITAQLIQAKDGFHLWSESYDRELTDVFAIQDEISATILQQLLEQAL